MSPRRAAARRQRALAASALALCLGCLGRLREPLGEAFLSGRPAAASNSRYARVALAAAETDGFSEAAPPKRKEQLTQNMKNRLREEALSMGDENTPISAGFGNPYLLVIVIVLVLGVATYFELGLDKIASKTGGPSDEELMKQYAQMQAQMAGR
ncbi:unnamed protein product [Prorocentrum cordatum]|uniref:Uncharacterized protein n=1 Tax=Prorocentrum cordatum TaxID=2364126 RepID=A0ABN9T7R6_9DINO|nr:unnamed protein product [Polarella glacialis]|mmetsp:Transcript_62070/g.165961  ORF Transcript_62070/g.165961 Transcript_62070/m.165961 type:complete len:155 (+) Transcript_62070:2-466(+)